MSDAGVPWPVLAGWPAGEEDDGGADVTGPRRWWAGPLDVEGFAVASVAACARWATRLGRTRGGAPDLTVDTADVAAAFASSRHLRADGRAVVGFAPLSRFFVAADGWVRFHANYPHHRLALLTALGIDPAVEDDAAVVMVGAAARRESALTLESLARSAGGVAAAMRTPEEWLAHEQGALVASGPLVRTWLAADSGGSGGADGGTGASGAPGGPGASGEPGGPGAPGGDARRALEASSDGPMSGLRVLDLTRVVAGPTATRTLGALGADVLRVDPPGRPELLDQHLDTGFAKRSAVADLTDPVPRRRVEELLAAADVLVTGYRPGALAALGLGAEEVLARHPHLVVAEFSAWGARGPWAHERGFDSIVQVASGIAYRYATSGPGGLRPGALPVQALDHTAGYLLAASVMQGLAERPDRGGRGIRVSLARVAHELQSLPVPEAEQLREGAGPADAPPARAGTLGEPPVRTAVMASEYGPLVHVPPPWRDGGSSLTYPGPPRPYGADDLRWR